MMNRLIPVISLVVIVASLYVILSPEFKEERVVGKIYTEPVDIQKVEIEKIEIKYKERVFYLNSNTKDAQKLLYFVQKILPQLEVELGDLSKFKSEEEIEELMRNSSYVLIVLRNEHYISFGKLGYPCHKLIIFLNGEYAGNVGIQPLGGPEQIAAPLWRLAKIPEDNFSEFLDFIEKIS